MRRNGFFAVALGLLMLTAGAVSMGFSGVAGGRGEALPPQAAAPDGQLGPQHETLARLAGEFELTSRFWPEPGGEPRVAHLIATRSLVLEGRVLRLDAGSEAIGFQGTGLMGYDMSTQRFWYLWTDTSNTGFSRLEGVLDSQGSGTLNGARSTAVGPSPLRIEFRRDGAVEIHDYYVPAESGGEQQFLQLVYHRRQ